ncbi:DUF5991 domain-containing protein [Chitinophaga qingshengii]|uniref:Lipocalin-like domain-containing protein n=1 Tax=Chitinophaga qingshengii TaxID=1569794 RepID=A0ABR7TMZ8_9BACT|nr:DUF5991 domain-containing protein [Chitinophaga qingshengii]MBC9930881.1 hypothetical protein [Chitinophaga qingshengii]
MLNKNMPALALVILKLVTQGCSETSSGKVLQPWSGHYELSASRGETMNGLDVATLYEIDIANDSCLFTADGIQYTFHNKCTLRTNGDTLLGYYCYDLDGIDRHRDNNVPLFKIFKKDTSYYIVSSAILEDRTQTYLLKHTPESEKIQ